MPAVLLPRQVQRCAGSDDGLKKPGPRREGGQCMSIEENKKMRKQASSMAD